MKLECENHDTARYLKWSYVQWHGHRIPSSYTVMSNTRSGCCWENYFCVLGHESVIKDRAIKIYQSGTQRSVLKIKPNISTCSQSIVKINVK